MARSSAACTAGGALTMPRCRSSQRPRPKSSGAPGRSAGRHGHRLDAATRAGDQAPPRRRRCVPCRAHCSASLRRSAWARAEYRGKPRAAARPRRACRHAAPRLSARARAATEREQAADAGSLARHGGDGSGRDPGPWQRLARRRHALPRRARAAGLEPAQRACVVGHPPTRRGRGCGGCDEGGPARRAGGRGRAGRVGDARAGLGDDQRAGRVVPDLLPVARVREAQVHAGVPARQRACAPRAPQPPGESPARALLRARGLSLQAGPHGGAPDGALHRRRRAALSAAPAPACRPAFLPMGTPPPSADRPPAPSVTFRPGG